MIADPVVDMPDGKVPAGKVHHTCAPVGDGGLLLGRAVAAQLRINRPHIAKGLSCPGLIGDSRDIAREVGRALDPVFFIPYQGFKDLLFNKVLTEMISL